MLSKRFQQALKLASIVGIALCLTASGNSHARAQTLTRTHIVRSKETLASISEAFYGTSTHESVLVSANGLDAQGGSAVVVGMPLHIPSSSFHRVKAGDTWASLADRYYGDRRRAFLIVESNRADPKVPPDTDSELRIPYALPYVATQNDTIQRLIKRFYPKSKDSPPIKRFNFLRRNRLKRGQLLLLPLPHLRLSKTLKPLSNDDLASSTTQGQQRHQAQTQATSKLKTLRKQLQQGTFLTSLEPLSALLQNQALSQRQRAQTHMLLGIAYSAFKHTKPAMKHFTKALRAHPEVKLENWAASPAIKTTYQKAKSKVARERKSLQTR